MCKGADHPDDLRSEWLAIRAEVLQRAVSLDEADDVTQEIVALLHTAQGDRQEAKVAGAELGLPLGTVTTRLRRARDKTDATVRRSMAEDAGRTERARFTKRGRKRWSRQR